tara:strand:+ start:337 stop:579 length:243 start_codon:yes stop_codon:yes gene_type:complete
MGHRVGDLIKWVSYHDAFEASGDVVTGISPVYSRGIVIEVSKVKEGAVIAHCFDCKGSSLVVLDATHDGIVVISEGKQNG